VIKNYVQKSNHKDNGEFVYQSAHKPHMAENHKACLPIPFFLNAAGQGSADS
jgi:hypothetical protein